MSATSERSVRRVNECIGGDKRPTLRNSLVSGGPDLARGSEVFYYSSAGFLTVRRGQLSWVSYRSARSAQLEITNSPVAAADWNSFEQSFARPRASLGSKATPVEEIVTRATESFGTANLYANRARATSPATNAIFYTPSERELIGRLWR
jgi:hypothetical protein